MIALDTNVLVRYVVEDDPDQTAVATAMIERAIAKGESLFLAQIVLCELVWVLAQAYRFEKQEILGVLQQLRRGAQVTIEGVDEVRKATESYAAANGDFADYLIAERAIASGCTLVATFDRKLHADARFASPDRAS
ncbi:MAG: type II toxin-antitoxin system VapC family toxin [Acidobacteriota bacterium]